MKKVGLVGVAVFEILCGLGGVVMVLGGIAGVTPYDAVSILWYGLFPLASLVAGALLLFKAKHAFNLSRIVLILQIPFIVISGFTVLRVGIAFNMYLTAHWLGRNGEGPTVLGLNALAIGVFVLLLWSKPALDPQYGVDAGNPLPPPPPEFAKTDAKNENGPVI